MDRWIDFSYFFCTLALAQDGKVSPSSVTVSSTKDLQHFADPPAPRSWECHWTSRAPGTDGGQHSYMGHWGILKSLKRTLGKHMQKWDSMGLNGCHSKMVGSQELGTFTLLTTQTLHVRQTQGPTSSNLDKLIS